MQVAVVQVAVVQVASGSSGEDGAQWVQQQLPTIATSDHYVVIASHTQVADRLIDGLVKAGDELPACPDHQQTRIQFRGPEAHAWLQENREFLIAQNMLDKGATRQQAETAIDTLINIVGTMKGVALELAIRDGRLHARALLQLVEGATR